jgi:hypothetical protein
MFSVNTINIVLLVSYVYSIFVVVCLYGMYIIAIVFVYSIVCSKYIV